uniref:Uncharacterized protein n=1 Tax=Peronospora matthiolae TaxID=2874970 RepID=A0AAV1V8S0_9STRA
MTWSAGKLLQSLKFYARSHRPSRSWVSWGVARLSMGAPFNGFPADLKRSEPWQWSRPHISLDRVDDGRHDMPIWTTGGGRPPPSISQERPGVPSVQGSVLKNVTTITLASATSCSCATSGKQVHCV